MLGVVIDASLIRGVVAVSTKQKGDLPWPTLICCGECDTLLRPINYSGQDGNGNVT
jgi:hypothetical protein